MYCQSCGTETSPEINYCKRCGAIVNQSALVAMNERTQIDVTKPIVALGVTMTVFSLGILAMLLRTAIKLASIGVSAEPLMAMFVFAVIGIVIVDVLLVRQMSKLVSAAIQSPILPEKKTLPPYQQPAVQLPQQREPVPVSSVTEHTTRTLASFKKPEA